MDTHLDIAFWLMLLTCGAGLAACLTGWFCSLIRVIRDVRALITEYRAGNGWNLPKTEKLCQKSN